MVGPRARPVTTTKVDGGLTWLGRPRSAWALRGAYCRTEGKGVGGVHAAGDRPNCMGLLPVTGSDPMQFAPGCRRGRLTPPSMSC